MGSAPIPTRGACMLAALAEYFLQKIRGAVYDLRLAGERRIAVDHAEELHDPRHVIENQLSPSAWPDSSSW